MFKNPLKKYQQGGQTPTQEQQKLLAAFIEWLPKRVKEFQGMQPEQIAQALDGMSKTDEGKKQLQQLMMQFQQEMQGGSQAFRQGGKIHDFICKHAKGGKTGCGCKQEGGSIRPGFEYLGENVLQDKYNPNFFEVISNGYRVNGQDVAVPTRSGAYRMGADKDNPGAWDNGQQVYTQEQFDNIRNFYENVLPNSNRVSGRKEKLAGMQEGGAIKPGFEYLGEYAEQDANNPNQWNIVAHGYNINGRNIAKPTGQGGFWMGNEKGAGYDNGKRVYSPEQMDNWTRFYEEVLPAANRVQGPKERLAGMECGGKVEKHQQDRKGKGKIGDRNTYSDNYGTMQYHSNSPGPADYRQEIIDDFGNMASTRYHGFSLLPDYDQKDLYAGPNGEILPPGFYNKKGYPINTPMDTKSGVVIEVNPYGLVFKNGERQYGADSLAVANLINQWNQAELGPRTDFVGNGLVSSGYPPKMIPHEPGDGMAPEWRKEKSVKKKNGGKVEKAQQGTSAVPIPAQDAEVEYGVRNWQQYGFPYEGVNFLDANGKRHALFMPTKRDGTFIYSNLDDKSNFPTTYSIKHKKPRHIPWIFALFGKPNINIVPVDNALYNKVDSTIVANRRPEEVKEEKCGGKVKKGQYGVLLPEEENKPGYRKETDIFKDGTIAATGEYANGISRQTLFPGTNKEWVWLSDRENDYEPQSQKERGRNLPNVHYMPQWEWDWEMQKMDFARNYGTLPNYRTDYNKNGGKIKKAQEGAIIESYHNSNPVNEWIKNKINNNSTLYHLSQGFRNFRNSAPGKVLSFFMPNPNSETGMLGAASPIGKIKYIPEGVQSPYRWMPSREYIEDAINRGTEMDDLLFALKRDPKLGTNPAQMFGKEGHASKIKLNPTKEEVEEFVQKIYNKYNK